MALYVQPYRPSRRAVLTPLGLTVVLSLVAVVVAFVASLAFGAVP